MKILFENCDPQKAEDRELPNNSFIVEYNNGGAICYDIAAAAKQSEIFDYYYDKFKKDLVTMKQAEGRINPKLWGVKAPESKKKK